MRCRDYERPAFGFTRHCLFSIVFVKYHGRTSVNRFVYDHLNRARIEDFAERARDRSGGRFVLDFLIEDWNLPGDFFFLFNGSGGKLYEFNPPSLGQWPSWDHARGYVRDPGFLPYLRDIAAIDPDLTALHYVPPEPADGINMSIVFTFLKSVASSRGLVEEIVDSRDRLQAYLYHTLSTLQGNQLINESTRTAAGAIIGRVNAHDFGHVLHNARLDLRGDHPDLENAEAYFDHFCSFLRGLMVFGAEVSTSEPSWSIPLPFMAQLVHYFSSTGRQSKTPAEQGWYPFEASPICRHLAQSEDVEKIRLRVFIDGQEVAYLFDDAATLRRSVRLSDRKSCDFSVAVPTGLVGAHALYCIFENIIRNGAKYGSSEGAVLQELELFIDVSTHAGAGGDLIRVRVWDDHSRFDPAQPQVFESIRGFFPPEAEITGGAQAWRVVDDQGQLVSGGWGIKEMRIAAGWLRKQGVVDSLSRNDLDPPLLKPILIDLNRELVELAAARRQPGAPDPCFMGYEFYLLKPRDALLIGGPAAPDQQSGIDLTQEPPNVAGGSAGHFIWLLRSVKPGWIEDMVRLRQRIPPALAICGDGFARLPEGAVAVPPELYRSFDFDTPEGQMRAVQIAHRHWLRKVLDAPQRLQLMLQFSSTDGKFADSSVAQPWHQMERFWGPSEIDGTDWLLDVGDSELEERLGYKTAVYDYHGVWGSAHSWRLGKLPFYEPYRGIQPTQTLLFNPPLDIWGRLRTLMRLMEAAVAKIAVVDERIFSRAEGACVVSKHALAGVYLPENVVSYPSPTVEEFYKLRDWFGQEKIRIASIHQGMIDKAFSGAGKQEIDNWVASVKEIVPIVVVHSDRAEALLPRLPENVRFVPFSSIEPWFADDGTNKYFLTQTLLSSRRTAEAHGKKTTDPS